MRFTFTRIILIFCLSLISFKGHAQLPIVDICLKDTLSSKLIVKVIPDQNFDGLVSNLVFSIKWKNSSNAVLTTTTWFNPLLIPSKAGGETVNGNYRYQKFIFFAPISFTGASLPGWAMDDTIPLMEVNIEDGSGNPHIIVQATDSFSIPDPTDVNEFANTLAFNGSYYVELNSFIRTGSPISCGGQTVLPFPVEWLSFTAKKINDHDVRLDWATAIETNSDYFLIEKKREDGPFEPIGKVKASGTTFTPTDYSYVDKSGMANVNTYRIRQVDFDGGITYSESIEVHFPFFANDLFVIYPSPAKDEAYLKALADLKADSKFVISDQVGKILFKGVLPKEADERQVKIDISGYAEGVYYVRTIAPNGKNYLNRLVKIN